MLAENAEAETARLLALMPSDIRTAPDGRDHTAGEIVAALQTAADAALDWAALTVAALSVGAKEAIFRLTHDIGKRDGNLALMANAYHHRSDALSSVAALVGIGAAMLGCECAEPLAVGAMEE